MSYINDALRKAQKERDRCYDQFGVVIVPETDGSRQPRKRKVTVRMAAVLLVLVSAGLLIIVYALYQPSPMKKGAPMMKISESRAAPKTLLPASPAALSEGTPIRKEVDAPYNEALAAQRDGDSKQAEIRYRQLLLLDPGHIRALNNLGVLCMEQKRWAEAIGFFSKAIILKKEYVDPYYNLACLYAQKNEIVESLWYLEVAMTINSDVKNWVVNDADMKSVVASPAFKKIMKDGTR
jgi:tetratricopeptide (TPR) repeat protein